MKAKSEKADIHQNKKRKHIAVSPFDGSDGI